MMREALKQQGKTADDIEAAVKQRYDRERAAYQARRSKR